MKGELIGKDVVVAHTRGCIIDETQNMLTIEDEQGKVTRWIKKNHTFTIDGKDVDGNTLAGRSHERIKKK